MLYLRLKKVTSPLRFRNPNSPCKTISTHKDVYEPYRLFHGRLDDMFC